jgi:hypothetical protein
VERERKMTARHESADYADKIAVGVFPWVANSQPVMQDEAAGWLRSIHNTRNAGPAGLATMGPDLADMVGARVSPLKPAFRPSQTIDSFSMHIIGVEAIHGYALSTQNFLSASYPLGVKTNSHEVSGDQNVCRTQS